MEDHHEWISRLLWLNLDSKHIHLHLFVILSETKDLFVNQAEGIPSIFLTFRAMHYLRH